MADDKVSMGWISVHRKIRDHWIWEDPVKFQRWVDLLLDVNHTGRKVNIGCAIISCERGQTIRSLGNWAKRWKCSKSSARRFLELLEKDQMIVSETVSKTTQITICNYDYYQQSRNDDETIAEQSRNDDETIAEPNNNANKINNANKVNKVGGKSERFVPPTIDEISMYCSERGNNVDANKFYDFYESKGWMVGKNKMRNWKASVRTWEGKEQKNFGHPSTEYKQNSNSVTDKRF